MRQDKTYGFQTPVPQARVGQACWAECPAWEVTQELVPGVSELSPFHGRTRAREETWLARVPQLDSWDHEFIHLAVYLLSACSASGVSQLTGPSKYTTNPFYRWGHWGLKNHILRHLAPQGPPAHSQDWLDSEPSHEMWGWVLQRDHFRYPCVHRRGFRGSGRGLVVECSQFDKLKLIPFQNAQMRCMAAPWSGSSLTTKSFTKKEIVLPQMATSPLPSLRWELDLLPFVARVGLSSIPRIPTLVLTGQRRIPVTIGGVGPVDSRVLWSILGSILGFCYSL